MRYPCGMMAVLLGSVTLIACAGDSVGAPVDPSVAPTVAIPNVAVAVTVGTQVGYDATRNETVFNPTVAGTLRYSIVFAGDANGLSAVGGTVVGRSAAPGVTWATVTATDALGRTASDRFAIVAFLPGLQVPLLPATPFAYSDAAAPLPAHFRALVDGLSVVSTDNTPVDNPITNAGASLGRVLYYDMRLSAADGLSCAGCHSPSVGFSDTPQLSVRFAGGFTRRHSPSLANARFYARGRFFWDERAATLEAQVLRPIQDGTEMGMTLEDVTAKIAATSYYAPLFSAAFGSSTVDSDRLARALAQHVRPLVSAGSRYDRAFTASGSPNFAASFTAQELEGETLFRSSGCAACHATVAQVSDSVHNIGLDAVTVDTGAGLDAFKAPSLRNVAVRPRFMHDGRFTTLAQVIDFFDTGVQPNPNLDARLKAADGSPRRLGLTPAQKVSLAAFLRTLTDSAFLTATRFASPFVPAIAPPPPPPPTAVIVTIQATAYHPATLTVAPGAVVTWTNLDNARHSASFASALIGATPIFVSGSQRLTMPAVRGTYAYQCAVHGAAMRGTVIVQ